MKIDINLPRLIYPKDIQELEIYNYCFSYISNDLRAVDITKQFWDEIGEKFIKFAERRNVGLIYFIGKKPTKRQIIKLIRETYGDENRIMTLIREKSEDK